jgi:hypothetical protein
MFPECVFLYLNEKMIFLALNMNSEFPLHVCFLLITIYQVRGKWLALQAAFSLSFLYGGRLLATSLFASFYVALPTYSHHNLGLGSDGGSTSSSSSSSDLGEQVANSRHAAVEAAVCLWATSLVGALMASNVVRLNAERKEGGEERVETLHSS